MCRRARSDVGLLLALLAAVTTCGCSGKKAPGHRGVQLDPAELKAHPPDRVCLELSRKLTDCGPTFRNQVVLTLTARGIPPDDAMVLSHMHTSLPGPAECKRIERAAMDAVLACYSNECQALSSCVLGAPSAIADTSASAPRCPDGATAYRSSDEMVRWCARPDGTPHGIWDARSQGTKRGAGTYSNGKRHGRFDMKGNQRIETYQSGRVAAVDDVAVSAMKSRDIDVAIELTRVSRNTSGIDDTIFARHLSGPGKSDLAACADELRLRDRFPRGVALVVVEVAAAGKVINADAQAADAQLGACLASKARTWTIGSSEPEALGGRAYLRFAVTTLYVPD